MGFLKKVLKKVVREVTRPVKQVHRAIKPKVRTGAAVVTSVQLTEADIKSDVCVFSGVVRVTATSATEDGVRAAIRTANADLYNSLSESKTGDSVFAQAAGALESHDVWMSFNIEVTPGGTHAAYTRVNMLARRDAAGIFVGIAYASAGVLIPPLHDRVAVPKIKDRGFSRKSFEDVTYVPRPLTAAEGATVLQLLRHTADEAIGAVPEAARERLLDSE